MSEFNSCYIGIPLAHSLKPEFKRLLSDVREIDSHLEFPAFHPHITLLYLGGQFRSDLGAAYEETRTILPIIRGTGINVGGYGDFNKDTIFLRVPTPSPKLEEVHHRLVGRFGEGDNLPFIPHITVCRNMENTLTSETRRQLTARLNEVDWFFPVTRLILSADNSPVLMRPTSLFQ